MAQASLTCSSIRKCGQTGTLKASARCATLSHGVMPPMRADVDLHDRAGAALQVFAEMATGCRATRRPRSGAVVDCASRTWPAISSAGSGSSNQARSSGS